MVGPRGFTTTTHSKDLRPGGSWIYTMHAPDGTDFPNRTNYLEVEKCAISRHPMAPTWPETMLTTVDLAAEGPDRTRVTVTWEPCGPALAKK